MGHCKPRMVQDKTGEGRPARSGSPGISRTTASAASCSGRKTNDHTVPLAGWTESGLQESDEFFLMYMI